MGNSSSKDNRSRSSTTHHERPLDATIPPQSHTAQIRVVPDIYGARVSSARGSRQDLSIFLSRNRDRDNGTAREERPRETKQEREARRAERERQARLKERERSMREEGVDGGYLVTLGVYTGLEDFNKGIVRQLQIERRIAPFWKGLNDHSDSWAEHQLVAAVQGLQIPAADEIPPEMARTASQQSAAPGTPVSEINVSHHTVPISARSQSYESSTSANLSASHPAFSSTSLGANGNSSAVQLFRGRAKTLASLATGSKSQSPDLSPQEIRLPSDPYVNGSRLEAYLYKDATECPICFMYYPPYLNRTRCCDQPICSECFVQIKRPDPHPPEHEQPGQPRPPEAENEAVTLVSEVAACPFCVTPEFGVSYDPPPFRRGLAYVHQNFPFRNPTSAMSSSSSLPSTGGGGRRRATSLSATSPQVITTDRVRPDWAKKLADARAHALRRSAAATALHNAAYVLGSQNEAQLRGALPAIGRRRRTLFADAASGSGTSTPQGDDSNPDLYPERGSSRAHRTRVDDLEDLMMMEAIRLSLAAEEERKKKEEKEARKDAKKREKEAKKNGKIADKAAKGATSSGSSLGLYSTGVNDSNTWTQSTTDLASSSPPILGEETQGKGKAPAQDFAGFHPLTEPTSTLNTELADRHNQPPPPSHSGQTSTLSTPQRHLAPSSNIMPIPTPASHPSSHIRQLSYASSANSSFLDSAPGSLRAETRFIDAASASDEEGAGPGARTPANPDEADPSAHEPMLNFRSLAAIIGSGEEEKGRPSGDHVEFVRDIDEGLPTSSLGNGLVSQLHKEGGEGEEVVAEEPAPPSAATNVVENLGSKPLTPITETPPSLSVSNTSLSHPKRLGEVNVVDHGSAGREPTT